MPSVDARYNAATNEIAARIQARNRTLMSFYALTAVILGLAVQGFGQAIIGVALSYAALITIIISNYHEEMIERLRRFQRDLSEFDTNNPGPDWTSAQYYGSTTAIRLWRDIGQGTLVLLGAGFPLLLIWDRWNTYEDQYRESYAVAVTLAVVCLAVALILILKNVIRKRLAVWPS